MARSDDENRHFSVTIPKAVTERIDKIAREGARSRSSVICEAVVGWLRRFEQQERRAS